MSVKSRDESAQYTLRWHINDQSITIMQFMLGLLTVGVQNNKHNMDNVEARHIITNN